MCEHRRRVQHACLDSSSYPPGACANGNLRRLNQNSTKLLCITLDPGRCAAFINARLPRTNPETCKLQQATIRSQSHEPWGESVGSPGLLRPIQSKGPPACCRPLLGLLALQNRLLTTSDVGESRRVSSLVLSKSAHHNDYAVTWRQAALDSPNMYWLRDICSGILSQSRGALLR